jgi:hypothetical protein
VLAIAPAYAVSVDIPFDFSVGNSPLKAGSYTVEQLQSGILAFRSDDGHQHQFALSVRGDFTNGGHQPNLVFTRYGNETFLNKVFLSADDDCQQLLPSSRERKLIQNQASGEELSLLIQPAR